MPLEVGIIGAGIAGLAAAIAQRKAGNNVEFFEASRFKNEVGAAVTMTSNGTRILDHWNFDHKKAGGVTCEIYHMIDWKTLDVVHTDDTVGHLKEKFGHSLIHYHRVDLHNALREMALDPCTGPGAIPVFNLGSKVIDLDCEAGEITIEDGKKIKKDAIIVADGVWSKFSSLLSGSPKPVERSVRSAFRTLIPFEKIFADEELGPIFKNKPNGFWVPRSKGNAVVTYPCRNATLLNVALLHDTLPGHENDEDWHNRAHQDEVVSVLGDEVSPTIKRLMRLSDEYMVFKIMRRDILDSFVRGRAVIIGDAAHIMWPTHAQGAVLGIEEAASIGILLENAAPAEVPERLKIHNEVHLDRAHVVQLLSNYEQRDLAAKKSKKPLFPVNTPFYSQTVFDFFYTYDAMEDTRRALAERLSQKGGSKMECTNGLPLNSQG